MFPLFPVITSADEVAVGVASAQFAAITTMAVGQFFLFVSSTACWIKPGANPTASAGAGSMYVPANFPIVVDGSLGAKLAVIRDAADGKASLTPVTW